MHNPSTWAAYVALSTAAVLWGGSIVAQKLALGGFSAVEVSVLRGVGALTILCPLWWWQVRDREKFTGRDLFMLALLGLGVLGNHLSILFGLRYISAAAAGVIIGASPTVTALLSSVLIRDVPFRAVWLGCTLSFIGVALVSGEPGQAGQHPAAGGALVVLGLGSWALYTIGGRRAMERFSPLTVNWVTLAFSLLPQFPLLWLDSTMLAAGPASVPVEGWLALAYLIVFATALGQQAWLFGVKGIGPSRAGVFVNLIPVSALLLSAVILRESIGSKELTGIALILFGVWLVNRQGVRRAGSTR